MPIVPIFHQINCRETKRADYRQAMAVLKYKPDIIIFELPEKKGRSELEYNKFLPKDKPFEKILSDVKGLRAYYKKSKDGVALSDALMWENIVRIWRSGRNILLYSVDGPKELRQELLEIWDGCYPCAMKNWIWWVQIYLRERIMANHIRNILENYTGKKSPKVLIFLQSFHWLHVKFLLKNPSPAQIYKYYFGKFWKVNKSNIKNRIKANNKLFYKYWLKYSDIR